MQNLLRYFCGIVLLLTSVPSWAFCTAGEVESPYDRETLYMRDDYYYWMYANVCSMQISDVYLGDRRLESYECAAYDDDGTGEQRECKSTLKTKYAAGRTGVCQLTVHGEYQFECYFHILYDDPSSPTGYTIKVAKETAHFRINHPLMGIVLHLPLEGTLEAYQPDGTTTSYTASQAAEGALPALATATHAVLRDDWASIDGLFSGCTSLRSVDASRAADLTSAAGAFEGCTALQYVDFGTTTLGSSSGGAGSLVGTDAFLGANPNCLVYLPAETPVPDGWTNVIVGGTAATDIRLTDGTPSAPAPYFCPKAIDLGDHTATFRRTGAWDYANGPGGWNTIVLPFDAEVRADGASIPVLTNLKPSNTQWKKQQGFWAAYLASADDDALEFELLTSNAFSANTPYLFTLPGERFARTISGTDYSLSMEGREITFEATSDIIPATPAAPLIGEDEDEESAYHLVGTLDVVRRQPIYVLASNVDAQGHDGFLWSERGSVLPFRAYILPSDDASTGSGATPSNRALSIIMSWEDALPTGIDQPLRSVYSSPAYDLQGRHCSTGCQGGTQNTVQIINGKKQIR